MIAIRFLELIYAYLLNPQVGQNRAFGAIGEPQRGHALGFAVATGVPQTPQKAAPGIRADPHFVQTPESAPGAPSNDAPQLMQRRAPLPLSAPQRGQGLYSVPQFGQNRSVERRFLEQLEQ